MKEYHFKSELLEKSDIKKLNVGDVVYITGKIFTARDKAHVKIINTENKKLDFTLDNAIIYHCGPIMEKIDDKWGVIAAGPTTSNRMSKLTPELLKKYDIRIIIGKGGMQDMAEHFKDRCVYLTYTGGCAALASESIKKVSSVHLEELGMAESVWEFECNEFGPLIVGIDSKGNDLFLNINKSARKRYEMMENKNILY
ncbi:MAG: FumA C-terminus/TtdB family hydratase beta subunit [Methanosarcinaceae archaeon]|nr:FumA C-terminus/TtdB family hydratase beta subunit [Methanosarcinaceae archaeon]